MATHYPTRDHVEAWLAAEQLEVVAEGRPHRSGGRGTGGPAGLTPSGARRSDPSDSLGLPKYTVWSQGEVASPNTKIAPIAAAVASGVHMNEWVHESFECSGSEPIPSPTPISRASRRLAAG